MHYKYFRNEAGNIFYLTKYRGKITIAISFFWKLFFAGIGLVITCALSACGGADKSSISGDVVVNASASASATQQNISIDGASNGGTFYGEGMISGGGGNSRLLRDYSEPYRSQILDLLFKQNYGASLQVFKVEIGSDGNSTTGSEPTVARGGQPKNYTAGYEGWLISEAKKRNPNIKFQALPWGLPSSVATNANQYWNQATINYITDYLLGTQATYGITFDEVGGRNERGYNITFYENLKKTLITSGLPLSVVASDDWTVTNAKPWYVATDLVNNAGFRNAVDALGYHTPHELKNSQTGLYGWPTLNPDAITMRTTYNKPLFSSEDHYDSWGHNTPSGAELGSSLNLNYLNGKVTGTNFWPLINSTYNNYPYANMGLIRANQPWSGNFASNSALWAMAQTTQFIQPGWQYLDAGSMLFNGDANGKSGSIVSAKSTNGSDWSAVVDMSLASAAQTLNISVLNLPATTLHVWSTNVTSTNNADWFVQGADIVPTNGAFSFTAQPGFIYSFTTTTGQAKGGESPATATELAFPYSDNFASGIVGNLPKYTADMDGAFEVYQGQNGSNVVRQMAPAKGVVWADRGATGVPFTEIGSLKWQSYAISVDVLMESTGAILCGRLGSVPEGGNSSGGPMVNGYAFKVNPDGTWALDEESNSATADVVLASGTVTALGNTDWHNLKLSMAGSQITVWIDGVQVGAANDSTYTTGPAGFGTTTWSAAQFANLAITAQPNAIVSGQVYTITSAFSSDALDNFNSSTNGTKTGQYTPSGGKTQQWQLNSVGGGYYTLVNQMSGEALDNGNTSSAGAHVIQWPPNGGTQQNWKIVNVSGNIFTLQNQRSGLFLDNGSSLSSGQTIVQQQASGTASQQWGIK